MKLSGGNNSLYRFRPARGRDLSVRDAWRRRSYVSNSGASATDRLQRCDSRHRRAVTRCESQSACPAATRWTAHYRRGRYRGDVAQPQSRLGGLRRTLPATRPVPGQADALCLRGSGRRVTTLTLDAGTWRVRDDVWIDLLRCRPLNGTGTISTRSLTPSAAVT